MKLKKNVSIHSIGLTAFMFPMDKGRAIPEDGKANPANATITMKSTPPFLVLFFIFFSMSPTTSYAHCTGWHPHHCVTKLGKKIYGGTKKRAKMVWYDPLGSAVNPFKIVSPSFPSPMSYVEYLLKNPDEIVETLKNPVAGVLGMPVALAIADGRNTALKKGVYPIPEEIKAELLMYFDESLLNSVRYTVGSSIFSGVTQGLALKVGANAITLGNVIAFKRTGANGSENSAIWAHEMIHVRQYKEYGLSKFAAILTLDGFKNRNSAIEKPAYRFDDLFSKIQADRHITSRLLVGLGGKCMKAVGNTEGSRVVLSACKPNEPGQQWELTAKNEIKIPNSNNCLDVQWGQSSNRTPLHIWSCNGGKAQSFQLTFKGEFRSSLRKNLCVEVAGGKTADRTPIQVYDCNNTPSQFWKKPSINLISSTDGRCLQAVGGSQGSLVQLSTCNKNDPLQMWSSEKTQGEIRLINHPNKCLDVQWSRTSNGTPLHIWSCNGGIGAQSFRLTERMQIKTALATTKCVDVAGSGNSIQIFTCSDNKKTQYWNRL